MLASIGRSASAGIFIDGSAATSDTTIVDKNNIGASAQKNGAKHAHSDKLKFSFGYSSKGVSSSDQAKEFHKETVMQPCEIISCLSHLVTAMSPALKDTPFKSPPTRLDEGTNLLSSSISLIELYGLGDIINSDPNLIVPPVDCFKRGRDLVSKAQEERLENSINFSVQSLSRLADQIKSSEKNVALNEVCVAKAEKAMNDTMVNFPNSTDEQEAVAEFLSVTSARDMAVNNLEGKLSHFANAQEKITSANASLSDIASKNLKGAIEDHQNNTDRHELAKTLMSLLVNKIKAYALKYPDMAIVLNTPTANLFSETDALEKPLETGNLKLMLQIMMEKYRDSNNMVKIMVDFMAGVKTASTPSSKPLGSQLGDLDTTVRSLQEQGVYYVSIEDILIICRIIVSPSTLHTEFLNIIETRD